MLFFFSVQRGVWITADDTRVWPRTGEGRQRTSYPRPVLSAGAVCRVLRQSSVQAFHFWLTSSVSSGRYLGKTPLSIPSRFLVHPVRAFGMRSRVPGCCFGGAAASRRRPHLCPSYKNLPATRGRTQGRVIHSHGAARGGGRAPPPPRAASATLPG